MENKKLRYNFHLVRSVDKDGYPVIDATNLSHITSMTKYVKEPDSIGFNLDFNFYAEEEKEFNHDIHTWIFNNFKEVEQINHYILEITEEEEPELHFSILSKLRGEEEFHKILFKQIDKTDYINVFSQSIENFQEYQLKALSTPLEPEDKDETQKVFNDYETIRSSLIKLLGNFYQDYIKSNSPKKTVFTDNSIEQLGYKQPNYLTQITDKALKIPFTTTYTPEELDGETTIRHEIKTIPNKNNEIETAIELKGWTDNYDTFDLQIVEAWLTEKKENQDAKGVTFLDLANDIYHPRTGFKLKSRHKFVEEVTERAIRLTSTPVIIDFNQHLNYMAGDNNEDKETRKNYQNYRKNGGRGIIKFNLIEARVKPIVKQNGTVLDGLEMTPMDSTEIWLDQYLELTKGLKTIPEPLLISPLKATVENQKILRYLAGKLVQLPFNSNKLDLFKEKYKILQLEQDGVETETLYKQIALKQNRRKTKDYTIRVDTLKDELKLKTANSRLTDKIEKILDYWKSKGYITSYEIVYNKRSKEKYVIRIF